ncbi:MULTISPECIES: hypothetical protein [unclassified Streptomyces]|uniref:hypothetical protein n=1 Tax=unclassified Streptomyces TaxID=2593676 RepID=UPI00403CCE4C
MMREPQEDTRFEDRDRRRLALDIRARKRAWTVTGSVVTTAGVGLLVLPGVFAQGGSAGPQPRPVASAESVPGPSTVRAASSAQEAPMSRGASAR